MASLQRLLTHEHAQGTCCSDDEDLHDHSIEGEACIGDEVVNTREEQLRLTVIKHMGRFAAAVDLINPGIGLSPGSMMLAIPDGTLQG